jgi:L-threonylcarbamoyladenylate synthase
VSSAEENIAHAVSRLTSGGVVVFPTDTVYGVGALSDQLGGVERIYRMKGRPRSRALIVHCRGTASIAAFAEDVPDYAIALANAFWPGPLTLVLRKSSAVSGEVTGGAETVGLRAPDHPLALALLAALAQHHGREVGIAAPSANRFGEPPPITAEEVITALAPAGGDPDEGPDLILDGGTCRGGVPSTVLLCVGPWPRLLRHGSTSVAAIEQVIGRWVDT